MVMDSSTQLPPGTVPIEDLLDNKIVLSPQPSSDPNQPLNWSTWRKTWHMIILCYYGLMVFAVLCVPPPLWVSIVDEIGVTYDDLNNSYAVGQGAMAFGCIIFVPFALKYGRRPIYIITALIMLASAVWYGKASTKNDLYGINVIVGLAGSVNETLFQLTVTDLFYVHQRGTMNGVFLFMVLCGNYLGPVAGGYVAVSQGWRWVYWYCCAFMGLSCILVIFGLEESKYIPPTPPTRSLASTPNVDSDNEKTNITKMEVDLPSSNQDVTLSRDGKHVRENLVDYTIPKHSIRKRFALYTMDEKKDAGLGFLRHFYQPFLILVQFPAVMFAALQYGWQIGILVVLAVVQAYLYPVAPYNFSAAMVGLQNVPPAIGVGIGCIIGGPLNDFLILQVAKKRKGIYEPESRLIMFLVPGLSMTIGTVVFGTTIAQGQPWIIQAIGAGFIGVSLGAGGDMALTYVQDSYQDIVGDALVGVTFVRNSLATIMIFAIPPWMNTMGVYNMWVLIGVLSAIVAFTCVPLLIWGRHWRTKLAGKYAYYAKKQY